MHYLREQMLGFDQVNEAAEKFIAKFPPNTDIKDVDGMAWSMWDGNLALVHGPRYSGAADPHDFDPLTMHRRYCIRYALTPDRKKKVKAIPKYLGMEPHVLNPRVEYTKTSWSMGTPGYGVVDTGTFDKHFCVWVKIPLKELYPGEVNAVMHALNRDGYYDATGARYNLGQAAWKKAFSMGFDKAINDNKLSNAVDAMITDVLGHYAKDTAEEKRTWDRVEGVYRMNKPRDKFMFIVHKV